MSDFIEVTQVTDNSKVLIPVNSIKYIEETSAGVEIALDIICKRKCWYGLSVLVIESYNEIKEKICVPYAISCK